jgi:hypothetical protein
MKLSHKAILLKPMPGNCPDLSTISDKPYSDVHYKVFELVHEQIAGLVADFETMETAWDLAL